jgi:hypothetical protein
LPLIIELKTGDKKVVICHADYPHSEYEFDKPVDAELVIWNRERVSDAQDGIVHEITGAHLFIFGHTPARQPLKYANQMYIDTGAVFGGRLTLLQVQVVVMLNRTQRRCKICRAKFTAAFENQRWCCPEHGAEFAMQELEKKREQAQAKEKKERAAWRKRKAAVKPLRHWEDMTQRVVNDYIRERDHDLPCISCGIRNGSVGGRALPIPR